MIHLAVLERLGLAVAAISGTTDGDCASRPDTAVTRNAFLAQCGIAPEHLARARQVHGTAVHYANAGYLAAFSADMPQGWPAGDGLVTDVPGVAVGITVADCVPLWVFDPVRKALGVFHAGREGTVAGIASRGVMAMGDRFGCLSEHLHCVIGPSAGPCCYEVSEEMARELSSLGFPVSNRKLDLWESNRRQLAGAGVPAGQIYITGDCTLCGDAFHSYRKSGSVERNLAVGML